MSTPIAPLPAADVLARASSALGKIDLWGPRGLSTISANEIEAMALLLASLGLVPTQPGNPAPPAYFLPPEGDVK